MTENFPVDRFGKRQFDLPDVGLVVVTGANGTAKSSLFVEAVGYALFGRTTRGVTIANPGAAAQVVIHGMSISRVRGKREVSVAWSVDGKSQGTSEGAAKAQPRIDAHLGLDFDTWHRVCIFSIEKSVKFATARDSERKELLEALLGLERFDRALKVVRTEKAVVAQRRKTRAVEIAGVTRMLAVAQGDFEAATPEGTPEAVPDVLGLQEGLRRWQQVAGKRKHTLSEALENQAHARLAAREAYAEVVAAKQHEVDARAAAAATSCRECGRAYGSDTSHEHLEAAIVAATARRTQAVKALTPLTAAEVEADNTVRVIQRGEREASEAIVQTQAEITRVEALVRDAAAVKARQGALAKRVEDYEVQLAGLQELDSEDGHEQDVIAGAEMVLGLRGARARLLTTGLSALEANTNHALAVMSATARVKIRAVSAKSDGTASDTISVDIDPWGGGSYDGASGGERKRLDLALMTAVASMHPTKLPLAFDDVFDTLDPEGVDSVAALLSGLAVNRLVIVITQNTLLADKLPAAMRVDL